MFLTCRHRRMYMPLQNYKELEPEFLMEFWQRNKDIIAVTHFADLMPEVLFLDKTHNELRDTLIDARIQYQKEKYYADRKSRGFKDEILSSKQKMRARAEQEIRSRVTAIHQYLKDDVREKYISHEKMFTTYMPDA